MWVKGEIFIKYYSKTPSRCSRVSFDTEKLTGKHREVFSLLSFVPNKEEFSSVALDSVWNRIQMAFVFLVLSFRPEILWNRFSASNSLFSKCSLACRINWVSSAHWESPCSILCMFIPVISLFWLLVLQLLEIFSHFAWHKVQCRYERCEKQSVYLHSILATSLPSFSNKTKQRNQSLCNSEVLILKIDMVLILKLSDM